MSGYSTMLVLLTVTGWWMWGRDREVEVRSGGRDDVDEIAIVIQ